MPSARFQGREFNRFRDEENIGLLKAKHPYFCSKKSDVLQLPDTIVLHLPDRYPSPSTKKVFGKSPTFPTPHHQSSCIY